METSNVTLRRLKTFLKSLENKFALKNHTHTKSQITDFPTAMPASDVSSWAKSSTKPSYTKSEVGLGNVDNTADANKSVKYATSAGSATKSTGIVDYGATAKTIQIGYGGGGISGDAIKYIAGYTTGNGSDISAKIKDVSKDALKSWLGLGSLAYSSATIPTIPSSLPANGGNSTTVNGHTVNSNVPANAVFTDTTYSDATTSAHGLMSPADKTKLNKIGSNVSIGSRITIASGTSISGVANNLTTTGVNFVLDARQGKALNDAITSLKKSVSDGKSAIASAITTKGVSTASDASFATMASNIKNISTGVSTSDIIELSKNCSYNPGIMGSSVNTIINAGYPKGAPFDSSSTLINAWYLISKNHKTTRWGNYIFYNFVDHGGHDTTNSLGTFDVDIYIISSKETKSYKNVSSITLPSSESSKLAMYV
jgi:hypothetical protein